MAFTVLLALRCPEIKGTLAAQRRGYFAPQSIDSDKVIKICLPNTRPSLDHEYY